MKHCGFKTIKPECPYILSYFDVIICLANFTGNIHTLISEYYVGILMRFFAKLVFSQGHSLVYQK